jgi:hypothetical protein
MVNRRKEILQWALKNVSQWPGPHEVINEYDPAPIGCVWIDDCERSSLPVLQCSTTGFMVGQDDYFYGLTSKKKFKDN